MTIAGIGRLSRPAQGLALVGLALVGLALALAGCAGPSCPAPVASAPHLTLAPSRFDKLPGWSDDDVAAAVPAFLRSCARFDGRPAESRLDPAARGDNFGCVADWRPLCAEAESLPPGDSGAARRFFEANFVPALASKAGDADGLFTGYYQPVLMASRRRRGPYRVPVYRTPRDLVRGEPYLTRAQIDDGALKGRGLALMYLKSPDDLYVMQEQGSGRVRLTDGTSELLVYDANNGRAPVNIAQVLLQRGDIPAAQFSQEAVRAWMRDHPQRAEALRRRNPEYVFFRETRGPGPIGAEGAVLTPGRSLAVDHRYVPLGMPLWLSARDEFRPRGLDRLVVAQDIGDGIEGPVRGDFYWGSGAAALSRGGDFYANGRYYLLLPKSIAAPALAER